VIFRRGRFSDVIRRQLDLFERDYTDLFEQIVAAERAYDDADRDDAEARYGEYVDLVEEGTEALADIRDSFKRTLAEPADEEYEEAFNRAVRKRFPRFGPEIDLR
jgi:hypothetical protein